MKDGSGSTSWEIQLTMESSKTGNLWLFMKCFFWKKNVPKTADTRTTRQASLTCMFEMQNQLPIAVHVVNLLNLVSVWPLASRITQCIPHAEKSSEQNQKPLFPDDWTGWILSLNESSILRLHPCGVNQVWTRASPLPSLRTSLQSQSASHQQKPTFRPSTTG